MSCVKYNTEWENIPQMLIAGAAGSCGPVAFGRHKFSNLRIKLACADLVKGPFPIQYSNLFPTYFVGGFLLLISDVNPC